MHKEKKNNCNLLFTSHRDALSPWELNSNSRMSSFESLLYILVTEYRACETRSWRGEGRERLPLNSASFRLALRGGGGPEASSSSCFDFLAVDICIYTYIGASHDNSGRFSRRRAELMITPGKRAARTFARITYPIFAFMYGRMSVWKEEGDL